MNNTIQFNRPSGLADDHFGVEKETDQMRTKTNSSWAKHIDFTIGDIVCIIVSFYAAYYLRFSTFKGIGDPTYRAPLFFVVALALVMDLGFSFHHEILQRGYLRELRITFEYVTIIVASLAMYQYLLKIGAQFSRQLYLMFWAIAWSLIFVFHVAYKKIINKHLSDRKNLSRLVLVTDSVNIDDDIAALYDASTNRYTVKAVAVVGNAKETDKPDGIDENTYFLKGSDELFDFILHHVVDEVLLAISDTDLEKDLLEDLLQTGIAVHIGLNRLFPDLSNIGLETIAGRTVLTTRVQMPSPGGMLVKRIMDIAGSIVGLIFCGIACVFVAPAIKIQSPGPVFFTQERVGLNGRRFRIYKFRSMYNDAEERLQSLMSQNKMEGLMFKMDDDPRITPIGKFIRKYSIDELPQFYNILKGDMSLVGTRPPTVREWEQYNLHHRARLAIKPGLTGLWQVSGRSDITNFDEVVALDVKYIQEWNIRYDIKIILKTIMVVFRGSGAE